MASGRHEWKDKRVTVSRARRRGALLGTIAGLQISEFATLFGFHEAGYHTAIVLSLVFEGAAAVLLGVFLLAHQQAGARYLHRDRDSTEPAARSGGCVS